MLCLLLCLLRLFLCCRGLRTANRDVRVVGLAQDIPVHIQLLLATGYGLDKLRIMQQTIVVVIRN